jgi:hypothetical protein
MAETGGGRGERATGTANTIYDLSSVLFHALEGGASYDTYIEDAERAGDQELADFFRRVREEDSERADEARLLIAERTPAARTEGATTQAERVTGETPPGPEPAGAPPTREAPQGLGRDEPLARQERARQPEREEDRGLIDRALDRLAGEEEPRRGGTDRRI